MRVLVACEYSGIVREAFEEQGHDAVSVDFRPSEKEGRHIRYDVMELVDREGYGYFDLMIAHPPCTYLANSGVRWLYEKKGRWKKMIDAAVFFRELLNADFRRVAVENPVMHGYARKIVGEGATFTRQPYEFGDPETKRVCWWTRNLPELEASDTVPEDDREGRVHNMPPGDDRGKERSRFFPGMAESMAEQWGELGT